MGHGGFQQKKRKKRGLIMDEIEEIQNLCNMKPLRAWFRLMCCHLHMTGAPILQIVHIYTVYIFHQA